ncbi:type VII toxin-antitoxin system MntA family adenylyltransferase antitoxin [Lysinibacillus pakistanensis]|uniref:Nucleotidyltransferase domain-containing protein n=1 Tax=Lysinibacillus pakistanensis TaxID=759811 RepID=A0AAX3WZK4_9BACI|nr:nucleotidyltransferase domain-containing protein [Lysinibacillus pakistanensis]MDM5231316.1 nucleotidyltransferase domain-containing protein [Lysinibacillus pakistanensis]WHY46864.1 nucleotidyltransferase domain-containing protein [Lysinibacillus pakistanensis]WHY51877.1 nucleotidyltransferase domain-containing protein [Lysinibacillus pakistanensis]
MQQNWQKVVVEKLASAVNPAFVIVFGSYAQGSAREDSDLDIAYFAERQLSAYERFLLAGEIAQSCNVDVDLVDILTVDTVFAAQIFSSGMVIDCKDENTFVKERMKALSMYVTLNEQRAEILKAIEERGSVYGE